MGKGFPKKLMAGQDCLEYGSFPESHVQFWQHFFGDTFEILAGIALKKQTWDSKLLVRIIFFGCLFTVHISVFICFNNSSVILNNGPDFDGSLSLELLNLAEPIPHSDYIETVPLTGMSASCTIAWQLSKIILS